LSPVTHGDDDGLERSAELGERVLDAGRFLADDAPVDDVVVFEVVQRVRQHHPRDTVAVAREVVEASRSSR
jgi:hypothetical protein